MCIPMSVTARAIASLSSRGPAMIIPRRVLIVIQAVSFVSVFVAALWLWITWPQRTAQRLVTLIEADDYDAALAMFAPTVTIATAHDAIHIEGISFFWTGGKASFLQQVKSHSPRRRDLMDYLTGKMIFETGDLTLTISRNSASIGLSSDRGIESADSSN